MLVLSRRVDEAIWIGDTRMIVTEIRGDKVRLGFAAPGDVRILREELMNDPPVVLKGPECGPDA